MVNRIGRTPYVATQAGRLAPCPVCKAKTGERCFSLRSTYPMTRKTPHPEREYLPRYRQT